jgi:chromosome partitioning protein
MITLAVSSLKGGVGKSTCAINLAFSCAKRGWKTLLVDADPQGSVGLSLSPSAQAYAGLYEILTDRKPLEEIALKTKLESLKIIMTGKIPIQDISKWCSSLQDGQSLVPFFKSAEDAGYDLIVLDTPSGLHGPTEGILRNCSHVLVPQQCEPLALRSLILPPELVCSALLPRDPAVVHASMKGMPLGLLRGDAPPPAAIVFDQLAAELEDKLGLTRTEQNDEYVSLVV